MVLYPHGRHNLWQCALECGMQSGSVGQPELCGRCHRCRSLCEAGIGSWHCRSTDRALLLLYENTARAVHGCGSAAEDREVYRWGERLKEWAKYLLTTEFTILGVLRGESIKQAYAIICSG